MYESNTALKAEKELKNFTDITKDALVKDFIPEILSLVEKVGLSGQSGGSMPYYAQEISRVVNELILQNPISPITGAKDEWNDVSDIGGIDYTLFQNNRNNAVFKYNINDTKAWNVDALSWNVLADEDNLFQGGIYMQDGKTKISSSAWIKSFPFTPKKFYIDVVFDKELDDYKIIDNSQLKEALEYYDLM